MSLPNTTHRYIHEYHRPQLTDAATPDESDTRTAKYYNTIFLTHSIPFHLIAIQFTYRFYYRRYFMQRFVLGTTRFAISFVFSIV